MKKTLLSIIILTAFLFIFLKSNTWETRRKTETRMGVEYGVIEHRLNWDNFFRYLNYLYRSVVDRLPIPAK